MPCYMSIHSQRRILDFVQIRQRRNWQVKDIVRLAYHNILVLGKHRWVDSGKTCVWGGSEIPYGLDLNDVQTLRSCSHLSGDNVSDPHAILLLVLKCAHRESYAA